MMVNLSSKPRQIGETHKLKSSHRRSEHGMVSITASAGLVSMETHRDSNGFPLQLRATDEPYRWSGRMQMLALRLPACRIASIVETPNWAWSTNDAEAVLW